MTQNTFKEGVEPLPRIIEEDVVITDREMAIYRYVALKLAYKKAQAQSVVDNIRSMKERKLIRLNNVVTRSFSAAVLIAIASIVIHNILTK